MSNVRSIYKDDVDFAVLALQSPPFNKYLKLNGQLDFSNPKAVEQLTKSLLKRDFDLEIELPDDRLCPPVPNRLNYILWIQDLLDTTGDDFSDQYDPDREVVGLDIGTGSSCIYPLLGCSQRPNWRFAATEIDEKNFQYARQNIIQNKLESRISPRLTKSADPLIPLEAFGVEWIDFTICNPPFYSSSSDLVASASAKSKPPYSACTGAAIEMVTPGGEVAFVTRIINESLVLKTKCQWYTSMLGKLSSVHVLLQALQEAGVRNWAAKEFLQGQKTRRWAIAWSFRRSRPAKDVARGIHGLPKTLLPFPSEFAFSVVSPRAAWLHESSEHLRALLDNLDIQWRYDPSIATVIGFAQGNVWSRAARRKRNNKSRSETTNIAKTRDFPSPKKQRGAEIDTDTDDDDEGGNDDEQAADSMDQNEEAELGFKIHLRPAPGKGSELEVHVRWIQGLESALFESFYGMLRKHFSDLQT